ncbi:S26 family signal peptidase [Thermodesulfobacteriota bacterium]
MTGSGKKKTFQTVTRELWEKLYNRKQSAWLTVLSGSMRPLIPVDAKVLVQKVPIDAIGFGDIILFKKDDVLMSHWVIGILKQAEKRSFLQQGTLSSTPGLVREDLVLGKVVCVQTAHREVHLADLMQRFRSLKTVLRLRLYYELKRLFRQ